jgi:hypothetical protein
VNYELQYGVQFNNNDGGVQADKGDAEVVCGNNTAKTFSQHVRNHVRLYTNIRFGGLKAVGSAA